MDDQSRFILLMRLGDMTRDQLQEELYTKSIALEAACGIIDHILQGRLPDIASGSWVALEGGSIVRKEMAHDERWFLLKRGQRDGG
jgi:hypothetical protein